MIQTFDLIQNIQKNNDSHLIISLWDKLSDIEIMEQELDPITDPNSAYFGIGRNQKEIHINSEFFIIFQAKEPKNIKEIKAKIIKINIKRNDKINYIPIGSNGIILLKFEDTIPEILNKLKNFNDKFDPNKNDIIYLTTKEVKEEIMKNIKL